MNRYTPITRKALEFQEQGIDQDTVQEIDQMELAKENREAQAEFLRRHPEASQPQVMEAIDRELSQHSDRYSRRRAYEPPIKILEDALAHAQVRPGPGPEAATRVSRVRPGASLDHSPDSQNKLEWARRVRYATGDDAAGLHALGIFIDHPDIREEPGLSR